MKTKFQWFALLASAAMIAQAQAGGHHGGGGSFSGGFASARSAPSRGGPAASFRGAGRANFGGRGMIYSGQRFSSMGVRSPTSFGVRSQHINSHRGVSVARRQFAPGNISRGNSVDLAPNANRAITNRVRTANAAAQARNGNARLRADWHNHVFARRSANWQRNWDRRHDHWWHGHRCHFVNGSWIIFDFGFYPWWPYWYGYDYYPYDYYPYGYSADPYYSGPSQDESYYDDGGYGSSDQSLDSTVAAAQEQLTRQGYYRGDIDGVLGPQTRRAVLHYQRDHAIQPTGALTSDTLQRLGLQQIATS